MPVEDIIRSLIPAIGGLGSANSGGGFARGWARAQQEAEARRQSQLQQAQQQQQMQMQQQALALREREAQRAEFGQQMDFGANLASQFDALDSPDAINSLADFARQMAPRGGYEPGFVDIYAQRALSALPKKQAQKLYDRVTDGLDDEEIAQLRQSPQAWEVNGQPVTFAELERQVRGLPEGFAFQPKSETDPLFSGDAYGRALERYASSLDHPITTDEELAFRRRFTDAGRSQSSVFTQQNTEDVANGIAEAIARGEQQPALTGLRQYTGPIRARLAELGYDLTAATQDWNAMTSHLRSLNSATQLRLRQATAFAIQTLDLAEPLIAKWDAGQFPTLNKARLEAAKQGALGPDAQAIATELDGLFADLVSELAVVYRGGLSPTDDSIKLARENLQSNWSAPVMRNMIELLRKQLRVRLNSIQTTDVAGTPTNIYTRPGEKLDPETGDVVTPAEIPAPPRIRPTGESSPIPSMRPTPTRPRR